jgi:hypothetical protein
MLLSQPLSEDEIPRLDAFAMEYGAVLADRPVMTVTWFSDETLPFSLH